MPKGEEGSQAKRLEQLHKMTAFLEHFDWILKALKHQRGFTVKQRRRVGASEGFPENRQGERLAWLPSTPSKVSPSPAFWSSNRRVNETEIMPSHVKAVLKRPRKDSSRTFVAIAVQLCNLVAKKRALAHGCMKRLRDVAVAEQADVI